MRVIFVEAGRFGSDLGFFLAGRCEEKGWGVSPVSFPMQGLEWRILFLFFGGAGSLAIGGVATFVDVEVIEEGLDVVSVFDPAFLFAHDEAFGGLIVPAAFAHELVPDFDFLFGGASAFGGAPVKNFLIGSTFLDAGHEGGIFDGEKVGAALIEAGTEVGVVVDREGSGLVEANFIEESGEVFQAFDSVVRATKIRDLHGGESGEIGGDWQAEGGEKWVVKESRLASWGPV